RYVWKSFPKNCLMSFESNVFINCPFDKFYVPLLHPLLFTVLYLDLNPLISETQSSGQVRVQQIKKLIVKSKYSIHDISRSEALQGKDLPRFNMPYEMGLDLGCQSFGKGKLMFKKCLVLEKTKHHYLKVISDIGGQDIENHDDQPKVLVRKVRNWFASVLHNHQPSPTLIWEAYNDFSDMMREKLKKESFSNDDIESLPFSNFILLAKEWIGLYKKGNSGKKIN
ncbi:MAG: hypothetical protein ABUT20_46275, partial [Bacteroidota bacterium]